VVSDPANSQLSDKTQRDALKAFAQLMGLDPDLLGDAYETLQQAKQTADTHPDVIDKNKVSRITAKKNYLDKELVYEDESAFIYRRGDTKKKTWYLRIFDEKTRKPFVKSLTTTDYARALTQARTIYQEVKGKIDRGERLRTITSAELVEKYLNSLHITDIPHAGVTPGTLSLKKYFLRIWLEYIDYLGYKDTPIDRLSDERLRGFAGWFRDKPREDKRTGERSVEQINNAVSEIRLAYYKVAVRSKYIAEGRVPDLDRLKQPKDTGDRRDVLSLEHYEQYWKFLEYKYSRQKDIKPQEKQRRILFTKVVGVLVNTGLRPKELLGLRWHEISNNVTGDESARKKCCVIHVRAENSKTGRSRNVVAPVKRRLEVIKKSYKDLGVEINPNDFVVMNNEKEDRSAYTRQMLYERLQKTIELSGVKEKLDEIHQHISLYSFRHQYISWRLRFGGVPIHLIAKNCGTSIQKIEETYGHIETEKQVDVITMNQGLSRSAEVDLTTMIFD